MCILYIFFLEIYMCILYTHIYLLFKSMCLFVYLFIKMGFQPQLPITYWTALTRSASPLPASDSHSTAQPWCRKHERRHEPLDDISPGVPCGFRNFPTCGRRDSACWPPWNLKAPLPIGKRAWWRSLWFDFESTMPYQNIILTGVEKYSAQCLPAISHFLCWNSKTVSGE